MHLGAVGVIDSLALTEVVGPWLKTGYLTLKVLIGFSLIIFIHELGHFLAAKWMGVRVDRFAVGFFYRVCGWRRGEGFTLGRRPSYTNEELAQKGYGETDYCLNALPFGGYVKMLGQEDIDINEKTGEIKTSDDPRAFTNKTVGRRMVVVSAGVVFNVLFAVFLYAYVFLLPGKEIQAPRIGVVEPGSPAAKAGLLPGDRVLAIDGSPVESFRDILMTVALADKPLSFRIERGGEPLDRAFVLDLEGRDGESRLAGFTYMYTAELASDGAARPDGRGPQTGDTITHVNGEPVENAFQIPLAFRRSAGADVELTVERPDPGNRRLKQSSTYSQRPQLRIAPTDSEQQSKAESRDSEHLLGFRQRWWVTEVVQGSPAEETGFQVEDVIAQWGSVVNPLYSDIIASIYASDRKPIPVIVERAGARVELTVTPRRLFRLFGSEPPKVGIGFGPEDRRPVVADVAPDTPAAALGMPRGAELLAIGGRPVRDWFHVLEALRAAAGTTVEVTYRSAGDQVTGRMSVPSSLVNELGLPPTAKILAIDGEDRVILESGKRVSLPSAFAVKKLLERKIGQSVTVEYVPSILQLQRQTKTFAVRSDNTDPWQLRAGYDLWLSYKPLTEIVDAGGSPLRALYMGVEQTVDVLESMYLIINRMAKNVLTRKGNVGVQNVAGPIGIIQVAVDRAESGYGELLAFLAFLSVNLAVLNFLPLPIVDGGLMVFLILERIRGKPLGLKVQVITTLTGLVLIVGVFLFVTIQDITRWFSGS